MTSTRVYLPMTASLLRRVLADGRFGPAPLRGHAVTPAVRSELSDGSEEEWEYAALTAASLDALALLAPGDPARRLVAAVDVETWEPVPDADEPLSAVTVPVEVPLHRLASVQADSAEAEPDVAAADPERCLDHELGWYAVQEVDRLLEQLADRPPLGP